MKGKSSVSDGQLEERGGESGIAWISFDCRWPSSVRIRLLHSWLWWGDVGPLLLAWYINNPLLYRSITEPRRQRQWVAIRENIYIVIQKRAHCLCTIAIRYSHLRMQKNSADWLEAATDDWDIAYNIKEEGVQFNRTAVKLKWIALTKERGLDFTANANRV